MKQQKRQARARKARRRARQIRHEEKRAPKLEIRINEPYLSWIEKGWLRQS